MQSTPQSLVNQPEYQSRLQKWQTDNESVGNMHLSDFFNTSDFRYLELTNSVNFNIFEKSVAFYENSGKPVIGVSTVNTKAQRGNSAFDDGIFDGQSKQQENSTAHENLERIQRQLLQKEIRLKEQIAKRGADVHFGF